jgi:methionine aminopeptidase
MQEEACGQDFNLEKYLNARSTCLDIINEAFKQCEQGMNFLEIEEICVKLFKQNGIHQFWHPHKIRIAQDTTKTFREVSDPQIKLKKNDLLFFDLGPVINQHEADLGRTFQYAQDGKTNPMIKINEQIFHQLKKLWKDQKLSGVKLYEEAVQITRSYGFELNTKMQGHRLGDFPHALIHKGALKNFKHSPTPYLWVLEIHIINLKNGSGAFFEDLLF